MVPGEVPFPGPRILCVLHMVLKFARFMCHVARTPRPMSHVFCACSFRLFFLGLRVRAPPNAPMANGMVRAVCCSRGARRQTRISAVTGQINMQYVTRYCRFLWPVFHARPIHSVCCSFSFFCDTHSSIWLGLSLSGSRALGLTPGCVNDAQMLKCTLPPLWLSGFLHASGLFGRRLHI